jgi:hypothetical protein
MVVYADVPTSGLDDKTAARLSSFLSYAATTGQTPGSSNGQLPAGYLPLTKANGLAALKNYTQVVAVAVATQAGTVPALDATLPAPTPSTHTSSTPPLAPVPTLRVPSIVIPPSAVVVPSTTAAPSKSSVVSVPAVSTSSSVSASPVALETPRISSPVGSTLLPVAILAGAACAFAGGVLLLPQGTVGRAGRNLRVRRRR